MEKSKIDILKSIKSTIIIEYLLFISLSIYAYGTTFYLLLAYDIDGKMFHLSAAITAMLISVIIMSMLVYFIYKKTNQKIKDDSYDYEANVFNIVLLVIELYYLINFFYRLDFQNAVGIFTILIGISFVLRVGCASYRIFLNKQLKNQYKLY